MSSQPTHPKLPPPILYDSTKHTHLLPQLAQIHHDCVQQDHTLATILDISHPTKVTNFWREKHDQVVAQTRVIILQCTSPSEGEVAGVVTLYKPQTETGAFRGVVENLLVSPRHRRKGVARAMMGKLEEVAKVQGRGLLLLDTEIGSGAELVYPRLGYKGIGMVPKYGISPKDGRLVDEIFFYKDLRAAWNGLGR